MHVLQIHVEQAAIDYVRQEFAPPDDPVFLLVPPEFELYAQALYESIGSPVVNSENVWDIYRQLIHRFEHLDEAMEFMEECQVFLSIWDDHDEVEIGPPEGVELLGGLDHADTDGNYYMGGVNNGKGLGM